MKNKLGMQNIKNTDTFSGSTALQTSNSEKVFGKGSWTIIPFTESS